MAKVRAVSKKKRSASDSLKGISVQDMRARIEKYDSLFNESITIMMKPTVKAAESSGAFEVEFVGPLAGKKSKGVFMRYAELMKKPPHKKKLQKKESA